MSEPIFNFRRERIEKLLQELRYEVERGMLERDIEETLIFRFYVPFSNVIPNGVVRVEFCATPVLRPSFSSEDLQPRLRLVKSDVKK